VSLYFTILVKNTKDMELYRLLIKKRRIVFQLPCDTRERLAISQNLLTWKKIYIYWQTLSLKIIIHSFWSLLIISSVINLCFRSKNLIGNYQNSWESYFSPYFLITCLKIHWFLKATTCYLQISFWVWKGNCQCRFNC